MDADESKCKGIRVINYVLAPGMLKRYLKPGKMQELAEELVKTQLEIVAVQEIRWAGTGLIKKKDFSLYYSGTVELVLVL